MKFQTSIETWAIQPHRFLQAFSQPGNQEHQLWSELCRISLERKQDPIKISMKELVSLSKLDEGQIIEQDVARVDHTKTLENFVSIGRDIESLVLTRAINWHLEHRIIINENRTVVFN